MVTTKPRLRLVSSGGCCILVDHHAWQGGAFAFDAVFICWFGRFDDTCGLQDGFEPAVASSIQAVHTRVLLFVFAVKMLHDTACKAAFVQVHDELNLGAAGTAFGYLA